MPSTVSREIRHSSCWHGSTRCLHRTTDANILVHRGVWPDLGGSVASSFHVIVTSTRSTNSAMLTTFLVTSWTAIAMSTITLIFVADGTNQMGFVNLVPSIFATNSEGWNSFLRYLYFFLFLNNFRICLV